MSRYYCPHPETGSLDEQESHHCLNVLRQKEGDFFTIFNGQGLEQKVRISRIEKNRVYFSKIAETRTPARTGRICLAQALTKNKAMDLIIQKATELGVTEIIPLQSDRSVSQVEDEKAEARVAKWKQLTIEAAKQCGQNWLPEVQPVQKPRDFFSRFGKLDLKLIASLQPEARPIRQVLHDFPKASSVVIMIGPEGDFTPAEIGEARSAGFLPVSLGPIILRSETAAIFTLSVLVYELGDR